MFGFELQSFVISFDFNFFRKKSYSNFCEIFRKIGKLFLVLKGQKNGIFVEISDDSIQIIVAFKN